MCGKKSSPHDAHTASRAEAAGDGHEGRGSPGDTNDSGLQDAGVARARGRSLAARDSGGQIVSLDGATTSG
jgi:hypothetical protein